MSIIGERFGRLVVMAPGSITGKWLCQCDCGWSGEKTGCNLLKGYTRSCGCLRKEVAGSNLRSHGKSESLTWKRWRSMKARCLLPNARSYKDYGGRGITICKEWIESYESFLAGMGECPSTEMTLDRIDTNGNYEPGNCRWADRTTQNRNSTRVRILTHMGKSMCVSEWAEELGINYRTIMSRLNKGLSDSEALSLVVRK